MHSLLRTFNFLTGFAILEAVPVEINSRFGNRFGS